MDTLPKDNKEIVEAQRFMRAQNIRMLEAKTEDERREIREYVADNLDVLARGFASLYELYSRACSKIQVDEQDLIAVLNEATKSANNDVREGWEGDAKNTRAIVRSLVFAINYQLGFEKYWFDGEWGVRLVRGEAKNEDGKR